MSVGATDIRTALQQLLNQSDEGLKAIEALASQKFYVVVVPDEGMHSVQELENLDAVVTYLRDLLRQRTANNEGAAVMIFRGERWQVTKPPNRLLRSPDNSQRISLLVPEDDEIDPTGMIVGSP